MAGSYEHATNLDGTYAGTDMLENMGDMKEAVDHMWFMIWYLSGGDQQKVKTASDQFYAHMRREVPWPSVMGEDGTGEAKHEG